MLDWKLIDKKIDSDFNPLYRSIIKALKFNFGQSGMIAGGCVLNLLQKNETLLDSDIDLFIKLDDDIEEAETLAIQSIQGLDGVVSINIKEKKNKMVTLTVNDSFDIQIIQFVKFDNALHLLKTFDIDICSFETDGNIISAPQHAWDAFDNNSLKWFGNNDQANLDKSKTILRLLKYCGRGYVPSMSDFANQIKTICKHKTFNESTLQFHIEFKPEFETNELSEDEEYDD